MISITDLKAGYGALPVLFGISLDVSRGETVALIGANGAGKTTTFAVLTGRLKPQSGHVTLMENDISAMTPMEVVGAGLAIVPEGRQLFPSLTVEENLLVGAHCRRPGRWNLEQVYEIFPTVAELRRRPSTALSGGQQQLVAIGRALMSNPDVLLCDELSLGLSPAAVDAVYVAFERLKAEGLTTILVEQDIVRALSVSSRFACMRHGQIVLTGASANADRAEISHAYFGMH
ncbi:ABC transporter ATP-binding protein [Rhizobium bangladeshense]|uniref:ABC transporter ATP-binding protein n=1 Tax=Rhizobium bangladeshense TaxID=1138189 RepID=UPI001C83FC04|nr:ABC transporter ATP-binding protein [Rhizobium bangladeshense]MBX4871028.1 ABC transporter ATP-binding protein [Rhizobium bangladeshense]MBX4871328.1 ABC transporter ATP-binding protein [Rhizobium bangladeshense]MBX4887592.1 ABC transporter ATP-binding protein [Rhizobium bangladeshense]